MGDTTLENSSYIGCCCDDHQLEEYSDLDCLSPRLMLEQERGGGMTVLQLVVVGIVMRWPEGGSVPTRV